MKRYLLLFYAFLFLSASTVFFGCDSFQSKSKVASNHIVVHENDFTFHPNEISVLAGESFSKTVSNKMKNEKLIFYLLKKDEDPLLVQQLKIQKGDVPSDYFLYKSEEIAPQTQLQVQFIAPEEKGLYYYVGISDSVKDSLFGTLIVKPKESKNIVMDKEEDDYESTN